MRLLTLTALSVLSLYGSAAESNGLQSARKALAEFLPDIAASRIQAYLKEQPDLTTEERSEARLLLGESLLRANQPEQALEVLALVESPDASYWQGVAYAQKKELTIALEFFAKIKNDNRYFNEASFHRIKILHALEQIPEALRQLDLLREQQPDFLSEAVNLFEVQLYLQNDNLTQAAQCLDELPKEQSSQAAAKLLRGRIALANQQADLALKSFQDIPPDTTKPSIRTASLLGQTDAYIALNQFDKASLPFVKLIPLIHDPELLSPRFEAFLKNAAELDELTRLLTTLVQSDPTPKEEPSRLPATLLARYYLARLARYEERGDALQQILLLRPDAELSARVHVELAEISWLQQDLANTQKHLEAVINLTQEEKPSLAAQAADQLARLAYHRGNPTAAEQLFAQAAEHPNSTFAERALLNRALLLFDAHPHAHIADLVGSPQSELAAIDLSLEQALALARREAPEAREKLESFFTQYPKHPRASYARLALAQLLIADEEPHIELINTQLGLAAKHPELSLETFLLAHRLGGLTNHWGKAVALGEERLKSVPESEADPYFLLRLAESAYRHRDFNRARFLFTKTAQLPEAGDLKEVALLYSARANLQIPTAEATQLANDTLTQLANNAGPLASEARLLKARTLLKSFGKAEECLKTLAQLPGNLSDQPQAALLAAEAHRELSASHPKSYPEATSIYDALLADSRTTYPLSNQIHYLLARTHRENGHPELALEPCLKVIDEENKRPHETEIEWDYYYRCGFEAIDILIEAKRYRAALTIARRLTAKKGPRSDQAKERAEQIQLDHLLWAD